ncbi:MAG: UDP-glucose/GDP-mannose dehydrogenase family protein [Candidatus Babeliales bacterium]
MKHQLIFLLLFASLKTYADFEPQNIAVIGTGYVGLITGAGLADFNHHVVCADIDQEKIKLLMNGVIPIFEPGVDELVAKNVALGSLNFTSDVGSAVEKADIIIIAVGTPMGDNGHADLTALKAVVKTIADHLNGYKIIVTKSTVPIGTYRLVYSMIEKAKPDAQFSVISNPEFLREGSAIRDFFQCNPIVLGGYDQNALNKMKNIYQPLINKGTNLIMTDPSSSETIKYAWNAFSATRIMYVNELAHVCNAVGANIFEVVKGLSFSEDLLPTSMLRPGPGLGGSCLPKDTNALVAMAQLYGVDLKIVTAVIAANERHKNLIVEQLYPFFHRKMAGRTVAILGLSFKANTDDIRYSAAITAIERLTADDVFIKAYDPQAMENMKRLYPNIMYCQSLEEAVAQADAILLLTEWDEFKNADLVKIKELMTKQTMYHKPVVVDPRNLWNPSELKALGFDYANLGRVK